MPIGWQPHRRSELRRTGVDAVGLVLRVLLVWLVDALALFLLSAILPGFHVTDFASALSAAAAIGAVNGLV
jgi:hypothetical protein